MAYTLYRLDQALIVFKQAKKRDKQNQLRHAKRTSRYDLRRPTAPRTPPHSPLFASLGSNISSCECDTESNPTPTPTPTPTPARKDSIEPDLYQEGEWKPIHIAPSQVAFTTLVMTSARAKRLLMELSQKLHADDGTTWISNGRSKLDHHQLQDPVERDLIVRQQVRGGLEQQISMSSSSPSPDVQIMPETPVSNNLQWPPTPPPTDPLSDPDSTPMECDEPRSSQAQLDHASIVKNLCPKSSQFTSTIPIPLHSSPAQLGSTVGDPITLDSPSPRGQLENNETNVTSDSESSVMEIGFTANTHWAHPINFQHCPDKTGLPCDFCSNCIFGIQGLGLRKPIFVRGTKEYEWVEVASGHRAAGKPATRMCVRCATQRILISLCQGHLFEPMPGLNFLDFPFQDYDRCLADLMEGRTRTTPKFKYQMCAQCTRPALYQCSLPQRRDITLKPVPPGQRKRGCGLYLCSDCVIVDGKCDKSLGRRHMEQSADRRTTEGRTTENGRFFLYRADAEFLQPTSLLRMAYDV